MAPGELARSTFLIVGVGGLGSPLALALATAGAGRIVLVDDDRVDLSNLQRQILYRTRDVGQPKARVARAALERRGVSASRLEAIEGRFDERSAADLASAADVVLDGSDNLETKFLVNDVCVALGRPFVVAGVLRHSGQVLPVRPRLDACYRCLFVAPPEEPPVTCAEAGVLGATCGETAALEARAAAALATGEDPDGVLGRLWLLERDERRPIVVRRAEGCAACADGAPGPAAAPRPAGTAGTAGTADAAGTAATAGTAGTPATAGTAGTADAAGTAATTGAAGTTGPEGPEAPERTERTEERDGCRCRPTR